MLSRTIVGKYIFKDINYPILSNWYVNFQSKRQETHIKIYILLLNKFVKVKAQTEMLTVGREINIKLYTSLHDFCPFIISVQDSSTGTIACFEVLFFGSQHSILLLVGQHAFMRCI